MDSASIAFIAFGLAVALLSNLSRSRAWRSAILFLSSLLVLWLLAPSAIALLPLISFLAMGYIGIAVIRNGWARFMPVGIFAIVFAFVWLKKYTFLPSGMFLHFPYFTVGLSYIFFRVLHLLIESGDGDDYTHVSPFVYLLYTINFTTFLSGPIQIGRAHV